MLCLFLFALRNSLGHSQQSDGHHDQKQHHQGSHQIGVGNPEWLFCLISRSPLGV